MEKKVPPFFKMCARPCYYSGNRYLRKTQALTPLFTDIHDPSLHERTSKNEDLFESLTELCLYVLYKYIDKSCILYSGPASFDVDTL